MLRLIGIALALSAASAAAAQPATPPAAALGGAAAPSPDYAARLREADFKIKDFRFASGETLPELRLHYATLGTPKRDARGRVTNAVMMLHGTGGSGRQFLAPQFANELFGSGQPLDIARYFIILPDGIGHGRSSKPSDGLRMRFPKYDYADMVEAHRRLAAEGLKIDRLRLLMGTSMGCMHGFVWGEAHPEEIQAMMPMACLPIEIAGLNRMWRQAAMEGITKDPAWQGGDYAAEPMQGLRTAATMLTIAGGAPLYLQKTYPRRADADAYLDERLAAYLKTADANDILYQIAASRTYDPSAKIERMTMPVTWINSADDFINPSGYGIAEPAAKRLPHGRFVLIPATAETRGHGTHTWAKFWKQELIDLLARSER